jgi:hypothetical protein
MTETTNGDKPAAGTGLGAPSYESVLAACRWATRHVPGRGLLTVSESDRRLRVTFSTAAHQQEALRAAVDLGYAATADGELNLVVTGWDPELLAQRAARARTELSALEIAHREVAAAALGPLRERLAAGSDDELAAAAAAMGEAEGPQPDPSDAAAARPVWTAVPITRLEIDTASRTVRERLVTVAVAEQAILTHNTYPAEVASDVCGLYFECRNRHGYHDREAASSALAEVADGIHAAYELAWDAISQGVEQAPAAGGHRARSVGSAAWQHTAPVSRLRSDLVADALTELADVFGDSMTAVDVGGHMTCTEADAIARALLAGGHRVAASRWLAGHARGDDDPETDRHLGGRFHLDTYLDGLDPRRMIIDSDPREEAPSPARDEPTGRGAPAGAPPDLEQWARLVGELAGSAVVEDPAWHSLGHAIDRAHAAGWDVHKGLPRLIAQQEMPDRHPARELQYPLMIDCPAAMATQPKGIDSHATPATSPASAPPAAARPIQPPVGQPPLGR